MGRSKFPGKPSKSINRKRVSVLQAIADNSESTEKKKNYDEKDKGSGGGSYNSHVNATSSSEFIRTFEKFKESGSIDKNGGSRNHNTTWLHEKEWNEDLIQNNINVESELPIVYKKQQHEEFENKVRINNYSKNILADFLLMENTVLQDMKNTDNIVENFLEKNSSSEQKCQLESKVITQPNYIEASISKKIPVLIKRQSISDTVADSSNEKDFVNMKQKKTVTFKSIPESSDDTTKKIYNPNHGIPLVSIMKKECLTRTAKQLRNDCIVRPSRLTEILKNSNIEKLNSLKLTSVYSAAQHINSVNTSKTLIQNNNVEVGFNSTSGSRHENQTQIILDHQIVLPKRSARSCRVIKPNKRFVDDVVISKNKQRIPTNNIIFSAKCQKKKKCFLRLDQRKICDSRKDRVNVVNNETADNLSLTDEKLQGLGSINISNKEIEQEQFFTSEPLMKFSLISTSNKFVLRQPRLQVDPSTDPAARRSKLCTDEGNHISLRIGKIKNTKYRTNLPSCEICFTPISCKSIQQHARYGVKACDLCRKFISKVKKKLYELTHNSAAKNRQFQCRADENCIITPIYKANMKNLKKIYKERCAACWLKKCIEVFHFPKSHKLRLSAILPSSLLLNYNINKSVVINNSANIGSKDISTDDPDNIFSQNLFFTPSKHIKLSTTLERIFDGSHQLLFNSQDNISTLSLKPISNPLAENNHTFGALPLIKSTLLEKLGFLKKNVCTGRFGDNYFKNVVPKTCENSNILKCKRKAKDSSIKTGISVSQQSSFPTLQTAPTGFAEFPKRQRIDLKGPRVKHVCRSASIALGQQIATFDESNLPSCDVATDVIKSSVIINKCSSCLQHNNSARQSVDELAEIYLQKSSNISKDKLDNIHLEVINTEKFEHCLKQQNNNYLKKALQSNQKKYIKHFQNQNIGKGKLKTLISIDYWENYDPAEVSQTGFGLITTEPMAIRAFCFLCGSAGLETLIFCACCCEPYHQYCVQDEYNIKHSFLDETIKSLLDSPVKTNENIQKAMNRLNWFCPRCTVCYTCNMSSGSKVKCQKCEKNYHSTCLGTSKRLLGADRPLICANCLKCKSCCTTKVSKFVGNLPMCTQCFKLRKKGNFCPVCQRCYDGSDFDLKMMECSECQRWIHSKCEGLTDEQYNLLSTLPEFIEFICKKCSQKSDLASIRSHKWREAVLEEFKNSLFSIIKLLSKTRQASALLKHSPRKRQNCDCLTIRELPRSSSCYEADDSSESELIYTNKTEVHCDFSEFQQQFLSSTAVQKKCMCSKTSVERQTNETSLSLVDIKKKINNGKYISLTEFNFDMNNIIMSTNCDELIIAYKEILSEQFPWFQNETKACTNALEEDMFESFAYSNHSLEAINNELGKTIYLPDDINDCQYYIKLNEDNRICLFCRKVGEGALSDESRLLYCGYDCWVHTNCAIWSAEVFEEIDGSLQNVQSAISRGRMIKCTLCGNRGATVGCNIKSCGEHYHYPCAKANNCAFMTDKTVLCPTHMFGNDNINLLTEKNFEVIRPVYVELDRKRKKCIEPTKVQFHIGSLLIKQLGTIFPKFSDTYESIIPINFTCSRLYWSYKEPWKIVEYTLKTSIQNNSVSYTLDTGKNFTVDHSDTTSKVQLGLSQINLWHNSLIRGEDFDVKPSQCSNCRSTNSQSKFIPEYFNVNSLSCDGSTEEEPQSNADLLPPEIKDAIFEDLPHELLDGISMLDIFPKLMIFEDLVTVDGKSEGILLNEQLKDDVVQISYEDESNYLNNQIGQSDCEASSNSVNHVEDAMLSAVRPVYPHRSKIQKSKTEIFSKKVSSALGNQRSSSLNWNSRIETNSTTKKRKITKGFQDIRLSDSVLLSLNHRQKDVRGFSYNDENNKSKKLLWNAAKKQNEYDNKNEKLKIMQVDGIDDAVTEYRLLTQDSQGSNEPVNCNRCHCTYPSYDSYQRHLVTCEPFLKSEKESETTARSPDISCSHLVIQSNIRNIKANCIPFIQNFQQVVPLTDIQSCIVTNSTGIPQTNNISLNNCSIVQNEQHAQMHDIQNVHNCIPYPISRKFFANNSIRIPNDDVHYYPNYASNLNNYMNSYTLSPSPISTVQSATIAVPNSSSSQMQLIALSPDSCQQFISLPRQYCGQQSYQNRALEYYSLPTQPTVTEQKISEKQMKCCKPQYLKNKIKPNATVKSIPSEIKTESYNQTQLGLQNQTPITVIHSSNQEQLINENVISQFQTTPQNVAPAQHQSFFQTNTNGQQQHLLMHQLGANSVSQIPQNIISFLAEGTQNPLSYVSIPNTEDFKHTTPFIANPNSLVQGAHLQADASGNLFLTNTSSGLQIISPTPINLHQHSQGQVIGTLIQPQTYQIGTNVLPSDQFVISGSSGLEIISNPQVILTTQPLYYGLETIVQNTVMSSQQFMSTAVQGMLGQNASFSATTTQVFQASKIEPIGDIPTGYMVVNNVDTGPSLVQQQKSKSSFKNTNIIQHEDQETKNIQAIHDVSNTNFEETSQIYGKSNIQSNFDLINSNSVIKNQILVAPHISNTTIPVLESSRENRNSSPIVVTKLSPQSNKVMTKSTMKTTPRRNFNSSNSILKKKIKSTPIESNFITTPSNRTKEISPVNPQKSLFLSNCNETEELNASETMTTFPINSYTFQECFSNAIPPTSKVEVKKKIVMKSTAVTTTDKKEKQNEKLRFLRPMSLDSTVLDINKKIEKKIGKDATYTCKERSEQNVIKNLNHAVNFKDSSNTLKKKQLSEDCKQRLGQVKVSNDKQFFQEICEEAIMFNDLSELPDNYQQTFASGNLINHAIQPTPITQNLNLTSPLSFCSNSNLNNVPTNIVNPIQQNQNQINSYISRPTNRVLPMQSVQQKHETEVSNPTFNKEVKTKIIDTVAIKENSSKNIKESILAELDNFEKKNHTAKLALSNFLLAKTQLQDTVLLGTALASTNDSSFHHKNKQELKPSNLDCSKKKIFAELPEVLDTKTKMSSNLSSDSLKIVLEEQPAESIEHGNFNSKAGNSDMIDDDPNVKEKYMQFIENENSSVLAENILKNVASSTNTDSKRNTESKKNNTEIFNYLKENVNLDSTDGKTKETLCFIPPVSSICHKKEAYKMNGPRLLYEIQSEDGFTYKSNSITEIWEKVFESVQVARRVYGLSPLPEGPLADMSGLQMIGLKTNALKYLLEQLPGAEKCSKYTPKYHRRELIAHCPSGSTSALYEIRESPYGCARCEPYMKRSDYDMFSWLASTHRKQPVQLYLQPSENEFLLRRGTGSNLPMAMKYRTLKETYKDYIGVFRSHIHGRGLYCTKDIESGEMVIEYAGELIRSTLTDKRERHYNSRAIGCYMFKIDDNFVVDATMRGNAARFINHSCEPNCYSKVVDILGHKHIIIFALRRIVQGEELTYDYKFPFEDEKIPCSCGSKKCRKYLN